MWHAPVNYTSYTIISHTWSGTDYISTKGKSNDWTSCALWGESYNDKIRRFLRNTTPNHTKTDWSNISSHATALYEAHTMNDTDFNLNKIKSKVIDKCSRTWTKVMSIETSTRIVSFQTTHLHAIVINCTLICYMQWVFSV